MKSESISKNIFGLTLAIAIFTTFWMLYPSNRQNIDLDEIGPNFQMSDLDGRWILLEQRSEGRVIKVKNFKGWPQGMVIDQNERDRHQRISFFPSSYPYLGLDFTADENGNFTPSVEIVFFSYMEGVEDFMVTTFFKTTKYSVEGNVLILLDDEGRNVLKFKRA